MICKALLMNDRNSCMHIYILRIPCSKYRCPVSGQSAYVPAIAILRSPFVSYLAEPNYTSCFFFRLQMSAAKDELKRSPANHPQHCAHSSPTLFLIPSFGSLERRIELHPSIHPSSSNPPILALAPMFSSPPNS